LVTRKQEGANRTGLSGPLNFKLKFSTLMALASEAWSSDSESDSPSTVTITSSARGLHKSVLNHLSMAQIPSL
jgi:hypothetical protein